MAKYLALQNIYDHRPIRVVKGAYQDSTDANEWHEVENGVAPEGAIVRAGSVVDMDLPQWRVRRSIKGSILAPFEKIDGYHFDLEKVFGYDMVDHFDGKPAPITEVLHEYGIFTLEQVANNQPGVVPFTPQNTMPTPMPLRMILSSFCEGDERQVKMWIEAAKAAVQVPLTQVPTQAQPTVVKGPTGEKHG